MDFNNFVVWSDLNDYLTFVSISFICVQLVKELNFLKQIPTRLVSIIISFFLLILVNIQGGTFIPLDLVIYLISAIIISTTASGIADATIKFKSKNDKDIENIKNENIGDENNG